MKIQKSKLKRLGYYGAMLAIILASVPFLPSLVDAVVGNIVQAENADLTASVKSLEEMKAALETPEVATIEVTESFDVNEAIVISRDVTIELGGNTISQKVVAHLIVIENGANVVINNGELKGWQKDSSALYNSGKVTANSVVFSLDENGPVKANGDKKGIFYVITNHGEMILNDCSATRETQGGASVIENGYYNYGSGVEKSGYVSGVNSAAPSLTISGGDYEVRGGGVEVIKTDDGAYTTINSGIFSSDENTTGWLLQLSGRGLTINGGRFISGGQGVENVMGYYCVNDTINACELTINGGIFESTVQTLMYIDGDNHFHNKADFGGMDVTITGGTYYNPQVAEFLTEEYSLYEINGLYAVGEKNVIYENDYFVRAGGETDFTIDYAPKLVEGLENSLNLLGFIEYVDNEGMAIDTLSVVDGKLVASAGAENGRYSAIVEDKTYNGELLEVKNLYVYSVDEIAAQTVKAGETVTNLAELVAGALDGVKTPVIESVVTEDSEIASVDELNNVVAEKSGKTSVTVTLTDGTSLSFDLYVYDMPTEDGVVYVQKGGTAKVATDSNWAVTTSQTDLLTVIEQDEQDTVIRGERVGYGDVEFVATVNGAQIKRKVSVRVYDINDVFVRAGEEIEAEEVIALPGVVSLAEISSENEEVATINSEKISGVKAGVAEIKLKDSENNEYAAMVHVYSGLNAELNETVFKKNTPVTFRVWEEYKAENADVVMGVFDEDGELLAEEDYTVSRDEEGNFELSFKNSGRYTVKFDDVINEKVYDDAEIQFTVYDGLMEDAEVYAKVETEIDATTLTETMGDVRFEYDVEKVAVEIDTESLVVRVTPLVQGVNTVTLIDEAEGVEVARQVITVKSYAETAEVVSFVKGAEGIISAGEAFDGVSKVVVRDGANAEVSDYVTETEGGYSVDTTKNGVYAVEFYTNFDGAEVKYRTVTVKIQDFRDETGTTAEMTVNGEYIYRLSLENIENPEFEVLTDGVDAEVVEHSGAYFVEVTAEYMGEYSITVTEKTTGITVEKQITVYDLKVRYENENALDRLIKGFKNDTFEFTGALMGNLSVTTEGEGAEIINVEHEGDEFSVKMKFGKIGNYRVNFVARNGDGEVMVEKTVWVEIYDLVIPEEAGSDEVAAEVLEAVLEKVAGVDMTVGVDAETEAMLEKTFGMDWEETVENVREAVLDGEAIVTRLEATGIEVTETDEAKILASLKEEDIEVSGVDYYDISVVIRSESDGRLLGKIHNLNVNEGDERAMVVAVAQVENAPEGYERKYVVVHLFENGAVKVLEENKDFYIGDGTLYILSSEFSTFAVAYSDTLVKSTEVEESRQSDSESPVKTPNTGAANDGGLFSEADQNTVIAMLVLVGMGAVALAALLMVAKRED